MYISAMLIFGTIGIFRKFIPLPSGLLACLRGLLGSGFLLIVMVIRKKKLDKTMGIKNFIKLAVSGMLIGVHWALLFESYNRTTVPVATLLYYMAPTLIILLSSVFLKEKLTYIKLICCGLALLGMALVSGVLEFGFNIDLQNLIGMGLAFLSACIYATVVIINKKTDVKDNNSSTIIQLFFAAIGVIPYVLFGENLVGY